MHIVSLVPIGADVRRQRGREQPLPSSVPLSGKGISRRLNLRKVPLPDDPCTGA